METTQHAPVARPILLVAFVTLLSWLGLVLHNRYELPQLTLLNPQNSLTGLVSLLLFVGWWRLPYRRLTAALLLIWALLHLIGGGLISVLPLPVLPFAPEQSGGHYLSHLSYGLAQLPLIAVMARQLR